LINQWSFLGNAVQELAGERAAGANQVKGTRNCQLPPPVEAAGQLKYHATRFNSPAGLRLPKTAGVQMSFYLNRGKALLTPTLLLCLTTLIPKHHVVADEAYDMVILNGRVMDPESGIDAVRSVGIRAGKIAAISASPLIAKSTIDAKGLVVAPGFIDLHEHGQEPRNYEFQARDGVTTSLELEAGTDDIDRWYAAREGKALINFGVSVGHIPVRMKTLGDSQGGMLPTGDAAHRAATPEELAKIIATMEKGFRQGALAEGMGVNYTPGATHWEIVEMFRVAAKYDASVHVHLRYGGLKEPNTGLAALEEVLAAAAATGAPVHVVHVTSMGLKYTPQLIAMIKGAQQRGLDVTTECYPYTAGSTALQSAIFDPGWEENMGITYNDVQWIATGERLTAETFDKYRKEGGIVVIHSIPEEAARSAVADPIVMIASDGMPITGAKVHPRGQATFSRVLGHYVREEKALDLMTALRKMTLMPAQRLEKRAPVFKDKGRVRVGADADITIFDPSRVIDKATFEDPLQYSEGIPFVLVNGVLVVNNSQLVDGVRPGRAARAPIAN
jgi:N-acyl-D-aspartate/D-glutamate deacylase